MARQKGPFDAVQFTRESAERVASVVRRIETSPSVAVPLTFDRIAEGRIPKAVRAATFSGAWPIGSSKVVTFTNLPRNTASVQNLSWPITLSGYTNENCIVGKDGTNWWLVVPVLQAATSVFVTQTQAGTALVSIAIAATLNTNNCSITISQTPTTATTMLVVSSATGTYLRVRAP